MLRFGNFVWYWIPTLKSLQTFSGSPLHYDLPWWTLNEGYKAVCMLSVRLRRLKIFLFAFWQSTCYETSGRSVFDWHTLETIRKSLESYKTMVAKRLDSAQIICDLISLMTPQHRQVRLQWFRQHVYSRWPGYLKRKVLTDKVSIFHAHLDANPSHMPLVERNRLKGGSVTAHGNFNASD